VTSVHGSLTIHEILANNVSAHLNGTTYPDVIELHNTGTTTLDLGGMTITDDPLLKAKYTIPANTSLPAGGFLLLYADSVLTAPGLHTGFGLDSDGDSVYLYDTLANGQTLLDSITFGLQAPNLSIGRTGAGLEVWALCTPTIGAANASVPILANPNDLRINEWLGNADFLVSKDFVELYNPGTTPVALGGMAISDDAINYPTQGTLPPLSFMAAGAFVAFDAMGADATPGDARELPGTINSTAGSVTLLGANGAQVDRVDTISHFRDGSVGRLPDGSPLQSRLAVPSPGATNAALTANELNLINYLRITELMYHPAESTKSEYIEFRNMSDKAEVPVALELGGVTVTNGITYTFPTMTLDPGAHFLLVGEPAKFLAQFPTAIVGGVFASGKLDNGTERIRFTIPSGTVSILNFTYEDNWYPTTDGAGDSLQIVDGYGTVASWDKKAGWMAAPPSPGTAPSFGVGAGADLTIPMGAPVYLDGSIRYGAALPQDIAVAWTLESGPGTVTFTTANYQDANATFSAAGTYVLRFTGIATTPAATSFDTTTITVTETYETWAARNLTGGNASSALRQNDPDRDGYNNLMEYAMGLNPAVADAPAGFDYTNGTLTMIYTRSKLADPSIVILPQFSTELSVWLDETTGPEVTKSLQSETSALETWHAVTNILTDRLFGRITVIEP
jgi:Lamin Tail Domain